MGSGFRNTGPDEYDVLKSQGINSVIVCPLETNGKLQGFLGVDNPPEEKTQNIVSILQSLCYFILLATARDSMEKQLAHMSYYDALTGFCNRNRYINDIQEMEKQRQPVGIVYLDINGLKDINDRYGHACGDQAIVEAAGKMKQVFREAEVYRIGGDEFVIIRMNISEEQFYDKVRKLKEMFNDPEALQIALGVRWSADSENIQTYITEADALMYEDKRKFYNSREKSKRYRHYNDV